MFAQQCLKAYLYLTTWFLSEYSKWRSGEKKEIGARRTKKKGQQDQNEMDLEAIQNMVRDTMTLVNAILELKIHNFFANHKIEEDVVKQLIKAGFDMIECAANLKNADIKQLVFQMLEQLLKSYKDELKYIMG